MRRKTANSSDSEPPIWGRQKGVTPICSDLFRFLPICAPGVRESIPVCSDLFRFAPFSSDLFSENPFLPTPSANPRCMSISQTKRRWYAILTLKFSGGYQYCVCVPTTQIIVLRESWKCSWNFGAVCGPTLYEAPTFSQIADSQRVVFQKGGFGGCSPGTKPERGYIRMFPGRKTGTRAHSPKPPFYENRPFVSSRKGI